MQSEPNIILREGPAHGQMSYVHALGDPMPVEDVGGGSITSIDAGEVQGHDGVQLRVYTPRL